MNGWETPADRRRRRCQDILCDLMNWREGEPLYNLRARVENATGHAIATRTTDPPAIQRERLIEAMEELLD